jgi:hypothetical protein
VEQEQGKGKEKGRREKQTWSRQLLLQLNERSSGPREGSGSSIEGRRVNKENDRRT